MCRIGVQGNAQCSNRTRKQAWMVFMEFSLLKSKKKKQEKSDHSKTITTGLHWWLFYLTVSVFFIFYSNFYSSRTVNHLCVAFFMLRYIKCSQNNNGHSHSHNSRVFVVFSLALSVSQTGLSFSCLSVESIVDFSLSFFHSLASKMVSQSLFMNLFL